MSEETEPNAAASMKKPIQVLRERRGGVPRELIERNRQQSIIRKRISKALQDEPKTVPEISGQLGLPCDETLRYVMGMKKYGKVLETEQIDGYFKYQLTDDARQTETTS